MREKLFNSLQKLSRAMFLPVLILPIIGLLIAVGNLLTNASLLEFMPILNHPLITGFGTILSGSLVPILSHLGIIFTVGVTAGLANKKRAEAALTALFVYFVFNYAMHTYLDLNGLLAAPESLREAGQANVLGIQVYEMGILIGVVLGILTAWIHNRYAEKEFKNVFQIYGGSRFVVILLIPIAVLLAIVASMVWPIIQEGVKVLSGFIYQSGNVGLMLYGTAERMLIPTGLHHLITTPFLYTSLGGTEEVGGVLFEGARNIYLAELSDPSVAVLSNSVIWDARGISKMFGLVGASLAMVHTAKPENKVRVQTLLLPAVIASFFAGVTEPIEFTFIIIAPVLFIIHSLLSGFSMVVLNLLNVRTISPSGFIDFILYNIPLGIEKTKWPYYILVGLIFFGLYYMIFRFVIQTFNLKTLGREEDQTEKSRLYSKEDYEAQQDDESISMSVLGEMKKTADVELANASIIVDALGGKENIETLTNCYSRLRLTVKDPERVDETVLIDETGAKGIVISDKNIQVIYGLHVNDIRREVDQYLGRNTDEE